MIAYIRSIRDEPSVVDAIRVWLLRDQMNLILARY